ncbi:MAG: SpoVG family protein [Mariniblastus sp.]|nr:SpoVG family protein [Mariniblastus sp.]
MEITEVRIKLMDSAEDRLRGFCSVTFDDCFVVRDLKIIEGNNGPFVAMPSRKLTSNCHKCRSKNHLRANYCNHCGNRLKSTSIEHDTGGRAKLYADIAHPVYSKCREMLQARIIEELNHELELASQPGYSSRYDDEYFDGHTKSSKRDHSAGAEPIVKPDSSGTNPATAPDQETRATGKTERREDRSNIPPTPHNPNPDVSSARSKPTSEDFGNGIFD